MSPTRTFVAGIVALCALAACGGGTANSDRQGASGLAPVAADAAAPTSNPSPLPSPSPPADRPTIKWMLYQAAGRHQVNAGLVMAVAWYESGWNQSAVSSTGAIGVMQINPTVAPYAGPSLLGRTIDPHDLADNIELGTAILKEDLDHYNNDLIKALTAYNAGGGAVKDWQKLDTGAQQYVLGIYQLAVQFDEGKGPA